MQSSICSGLWKTLCFWGVGLSLLTLASACGETPPPPSAVSLNSLYNDEQPALSGDGRLLAFITNRNGGTEIAVYNLQTRQFVQLRGLNQPGAIAQRPSLSRTGRYIVYLVSDRGRPVIALYDQALERSEILNNSYRHWIRNPKISPDGRYIVFETSRRGQWDIEVLDRGPNIELDIEDGSPLMP
ncbi:biopolymer transporter Tol [Spirulina subsalsa FACHB-351]|uniref:Biopolymer transporter Tol n=1 Tax=Spirulina subsalsa FACHB-351 TaxID=234711 RepID=A0ABT3LBU2_9CYAN|nr:biopolymer transporter Tol [Spirulina subsalsa FACHB-351]